MKSSRYHSIGLAVCLTFYAASSFGQTQTVQQATPTVGADAKISATEAAIRQSGENPAAVKRGNEIYLANCGTCHGATGKGTNLAPDLVQSPIVEDDENADMIGPVIKKGRPDKGMPALPLTDEEISDVSAWLHAQVYGASHRGTYDYLDIVVGNAQKGEQYFNGAGRCNTCHSVTGDLAGIGAKYPPPELQSRWVSGGGARFGRGGFGAFGAAGDDSTVFDASPPQITKSTTTITVTLANGQKMDGVPLSITDFNVTFKDMKGGYHSIDRINGFPRVETHNPLAVHGELLRRMSDDDMHNITAYLVTLK